MFTIMSLLILASLTPSVFATQLACAQGYWPSWSTINRMSATEVVECWGNLIWDVIYIIVGITLISAVADLRHAYIMSLTGTPRRIKVKVAAEDIIPPSADSAPVVLPEVPPAPTQQ